MLIIPVTEDANQVFDIVLEGKAVRLGLRYQDIGAGWYADVDVDGVNILQGVRVNTGAGIVGKRLSGLSGDLIPLPKTFPQVELYREAWDITHVLVYMTREEMTEAGIAIL